jgi:ribose 1,5-bisphosphokinase
LYVIGRSGVGKDSILNALKARHDIHAKIVKRYITRKKDSSGEDHEPLSLEDYDFMERKGMFSLSWAGHGFKYGIGREIKDELRAGNTVIVNGSREYLRVAAQLFPMLEVVEISAEEEIVRKRILERSRENMESVSERLERGRQEFERPDTVLFHNIDNSGNLSDSIEAFVRIIKNHAGSLLPNA